MLTPAALSYRLSVTTFDTPTPDTAAKGRRWTPADAAALYGLDAWGQGSFGVSDRGTLRVMPTRDPGVAVDLHELIEGLAERGIEAPVLVRFSDMVRQRLTDIRDAFRVAIDESNYTGDYCCVYPIKVNQQRQVVEEIRDLSRELGFGLEAGSKPELLAVLGLTAEDDALAGMPIVCNGFKDDEYVETVILAAKLGRNIIPVVEQPAELARIIKHAQRYGVRPSIGVRIKPATTGTGRWATSGGNRSKFGLSATDLLDAVELLREHGMLDCLNLLHFHIGSQINDVRQVTAAVGELAHIYCELVKLGAGLTMIDIGGGMGVDYDGSRSARDGSVNYGLVEYAASVVNRVQNVCDDAGVDHPMILSESGRAMTAFSSVLVMNAIGMTRFDVDPRIDEARAMLERDAETPQPIRDLVDTFDSLGERDPVEMYHDAAQARSEAMTLFGMGYLSLPQRAVAERLYWAIGHRVMTLAKERRLDEREEIAELPELLSDICYVNFSMFQSLPDHWAIDQVFPMMPIHRLDERPDRLAVLADVTCDSDGEIDLFSDHENPGPKRRLELHSLRGPVGEPEPYYLGVFLVGAYQEVLGDLHNLFGDTHAVHVSVDESGRWRIDEIVEGDTVREVLGYVQYDVDRLRRHMHRQIERAVHADRLTVAEGRSLKRFYDHGLEGYTYLESGEGDQ